MKDVLELLDKCLISLSEMTINCTCITNLIKYMKILQFKYKYKYKKKKKKKKKIAHYIDPCQSSSSEMTVGSRHTQLQPNTGKPLI
jgi:hypothetical protein